MIIQELIPQELIKFHLEANTKDEAISELAKILYDTHKIDQLDGFLSDIYARENIVTTGIGYEIAIPHAKSKHVLIPSVVFARNQGGVPYDSLDGKDVKLFFMIAMPEDGTNAHLKVLAMLSRKLMHQNFRDDLLDAKNIEEIKKLLYTI